MNVIVSQPRYLPALNYLLRLYFADRFVIFDVVQREARGWENRNKLLLPDPTWLTIPVASSSRALIKDAKVSGNEWARQHKERIAQHYKNAPHFSKALLDEAYRLDETRNDYADVLVTLLNNACRILSFEPKLVRASEILTVDDCGESGVKLLLKVCQRAGATWYISGPHGREYGVSDEFSRAGMGFVYHEFTHPHYSQGERDFVPYMGYLDALFYCGADWLSDFVRTAPKFSEK